MWHIAGPSDWGDNDGGDPEFRLEKVAFKAPAVSELAALATSAEPAKKKKKKKKRKAKELVEASQSEKPKQAQKPEKQKASKSVQQEPKSHNLPVDANPIAMETKKKAKKAHEPSAKPPPVPPAAVAPAKRAPKLTALQEKMKKKLDGGHFRFLNEQLYTMKGEEALRLFSEQPELFDIYHKGFRSQVEDWPINPIDVFVARLHGMSTKLVVADFGCGEAKLAQSVKQTVHSFDLNPVNDYVTVCDIANVPLEDSTVDVGIFSLSLMGTNYQDFVLEARRVLKPKARLWVAEVKSRFEGNDLRGFIKTLKTLGFDLVAEDSSNKMFVIIDLMRSDREPQQTSYALKPCIYKRR